MKNVDVVVIGGSLAGAACARELSRRGVDVLAFDRESFPREKVCGGFLSPGAVDALDSLGVLKDVRAAGAVEVGSARVRRGDVETCLNLPRPGLGISRRALDQVVASHAPVVPGVVRDVLKDGENFRVRLEDREVLARVVIDAAGKLSRFTDRITSNQFGVQFYEPELCGSTLEFWFFPDGYGGAVSVEGGRSNACFLIRKEALPRYLSKPNCRVTGPVAYRKKRSSFIAVGDAAGMIDPFCGEGMRHALDTGMLAARVVAAGLGRGSDYGEMKKRYELEHAQRWNGKRRVGWLVREVLQYPNLALMGFRWNPQYVLRRIWE